MSRAASRVRLRTGLDSHHRNTEPSEEPFSSLKVTLRSVLDDRSWLGTVRGLHSRLLPGACLLLLASGHAAAADPDAWSQFRGPTQTGAAAAGSTADWPSRPALEVEWQVDLGPGYSGVVVAEGLVYTGWGKDGSDWLGAFDSVTGAAEWKLSLGAVYAGHDGSHDGPLATPTVAAIEDSRTVFAVSGHGRLVAATTAGELIWQTELSEPDQAPFWGFSSSPVVVSRGSRATGERTSKSAVLVVQMAFDGGPTIAGLDPRSGEILWQHGDASVAYQSPAVGTLGARLQVVASGSNMLYGLEPFDGELLWSHLYTASSGHMGPGSSVPLFLGENRLLVKPSSRHSMALTVAAEDRGWLVEPLWTSSDLSLSYVPAVFRSGRVFGYKRGFLVAVDAATGRTIWRSRPPGDGFLAIADEYLVVATKKGSLHLAAAKAEDWREAASLDLFADPHRDNAVWTEPTIADGSIYVRSMSSLARVAVRERSSAVGSRTAQADRGETPPAGAFAEFLQSLAVTENRAAAVEAFVAERTATGGFPILEDDHVIFVFRTAESSAGIEGDMLGERIQGQMRHVAGTDLYYYSMRLPRDAWISYRLVPGVADPIIDPLNAGRQISIVYPREPSTVSYFTMPDWQPAPYLEREPSRRGRVVHHDVPLSLDGERGPEWRGIDVYLPHDFDTDPPQPYPVVFVPAAEVVREPLMLDRALDAFLGSTLPSAVIVLVGSHDPGPGVDLSSGAPAAIDSFFERVVPFVVDSYPVASGGSEHAYVGFGMGADHALALGFDPRSKAGRLALVQPLVHDVQRQDLLAAAGERLENRAQIYLEGSPLGRRAEHEQWDGSRLIAKLAAGLGELGYQVTTGSSNLPAALVALRGRVDEALAFALTGAPSLPTGDRRIDE